MGSHVERAYFPSAEWQFVRSSGVNGKVPKAGRVPVRPDMTVAEGFAAIVGSCVEHFRRNEPLVVQRRDARALHQLRVALRQLRAALSIFRPAIGDRWFEHLRDELRCFAKQLGEARNLDVYLERDDIPKSHLAVLKQERERAYDKAIEAMESRRFRGLLADLSKWATHGRWRSNEKARRPFPKYGARRVDRLWLSVERHGGLKSMNDEERHDLRLKAKKLRYGLEFMRPLRAKRGRKESQFSKAVQGLQDRLGSLSDLATGQRIARSFLHKRMLSRKALRKQEQKHAGKAQECLDRMKKIGPYWTKLA